MWQDAQVGKDAQACLWFDACLDMLALMLSLTLALMLALMLLPFMGRIRTNLLVSLKRGAATPPEEEPGTRPTPWRKLPRTARASLW